MRKDLLKINCRLSNDLRALCKFCAIFNRYCFHKRSTPAFWIFRIVILFVRHVLLQAQLASLSVPSQVRFLPFTYLSPVLSHPTDVNKWMRFRKVLHWTAHRWLRFFIALILAWERSQETDNRPHDHFVWNYILTRRDSSICGKRKKEAYKFIHF